MTPLGAVRRHRFNFLINCNLDFESNFSKHQWERFNAKNTIGLKYRHPIKLNNSPDNLSLYQNIFGQANSIFKMVIPVFFQQDERSTYLRTDSNNRSARVKCFDKTEAL